MAKLTQSIELPPDPEFLLEKMLSILYTDIRNGLKESSLPRGGLYEVMTVLEDRDSTIVVTFEQDS
jgi:hypothetical protein